MNNVNLLLVTVTPLQKQIYKENLVYMQTFKNKRTLYPYRAFFLLLIYGRLAFFFSLMHPVSLLQNTTSIFTWVVESNTLKSFYV